MTINVFPKYGFQTPGWKGDAWALTNVTWVPRPAWIVEGMPKDPYYNVGKHIFFVDKENYYLPNKEVFNKAGEFQHWHLNTSSIFEGPSGNNNIGAYVAFIQIDTKIPHASITTEESQRIFQPLSKLGPDFFTTSNFLQLSK